MLKFLKFPFGVFLLNIRRWEPHVCASFSPPRKSLTKSLVPRIIYFPALSRGIGVEARKKFVRAEFFERKKIPNI